MKATTIFPSRITIVPSVNLIFESIFLSFPPLKVKTIVSKENDIRVQFYRNLTKQEFSQIN